MATFITLIRFTPQGIGSIKDSPKRLDAAKHAFRAMGAESGLGVYLIAKRVKADDRLQKGRAENRRGEMIKE